MGNFQDTFDSSKRSFISAVSICMTVPLTENLIFCAVPVKSSSPAGQRKRA